MSEAEQVLEQVKANNKAMRVLVGRIFDAMGDESMHIVLPACCYVLATLGVDLMDDGWSKADFLDSVEGSISDAYNHIAEGARNGTAH